MCALSKIIFEINSTRIVRDSWTVEAENIKEIQKDQSSEGMDSYGVVDSRPNQKVWTLNGLNLLSNPVQGVLMEWAIQL